MITTPGPAPQPGPASRLWADILRMYDAPGIAALCLRLQDDGDIDVMLLLCLCHAAGALAAPLTPAEVDDLRARMTPWRQTAVLPLRRLRIALRAPVDSVPEDLREGLRDRLKGVELAAERVQADLFAAWLAERGQGTAPGSPDPKQGLRHLLGATPATEAELDQLLAAARG